MDYRPAIDEYVGGILDGKVVAGRLVKLAAQRYRDDLVSAGSRGFHFDPGIVAAETLEILGLGQRPVEAGRTQIEFVGTGDRIGDIE